MKTAIRCACTDTGEKQNYFFLTVMVYRMSVLETIRNIDVRTK